MSTATSAEAANRNHCNIIVSTAALGLALLGALLGTAGAYLALAAGHLSDLSTLSHVPLLYLAITILGVPVAAALTGWILAGRKPPSIARRLLE